MILSWKPILCSLFGIINTSIFVYYLRARYRAVRRKYIYIKPTSCSYSVLNGSSPSPLPVSHKLLTRQSTMYCATSRLSSQIFSNEKSPKILKQSKIHLHDLRHTVAIESQKRLFGYGKQYIIFVDDTWIKSTKNLALRWTINLYIL